MPLPPAVLTATASTSPQPERADAERVTGAVAPLPSDTTGAPDPAALKAAKRPVDLLGDGGGIKVIKPGFLELWVAIDQPKAGSGAAAATPPTDTLKTSTCPPISPVCFRCSAPGL